MSASAAEANEVLPVTVIGGYLGAGKTTLVNHLLRNADGLRIAVLVNEFGTLPIDADLIEAQDDNVIAIAGGCVCCSYGNDLVMAMIELARMEPRARARVARGQRRCTAWRDRGQRRIAAALPA